MKRRAELPKGLDINTRQQLLGEAWWTSEFLNMMKPGDYDSYQLAKGKKLAERRQVVVKGFHNGCVDTVILEAVGGTREVTLWVMDLEEEWEVVFRLFADNQMLFTQLLNGYYAKELDALLREVGIFIIPTTLMDLDYRCNCISDSHICSHIVATYLTLGNYINENPMLLFQLRGKSREEIISGVDSYSNAQKDECVFKEESELITSEDTFPLADPSGYYDINSDLEKMRFRANFQEGKESELFRLMGSSSIKLGKTDLSIIIGECYPKAAQYVKRFREQSSSCDMKPDSGNQVS